MIYALSFASLAVFLMIAGYISKKVILAYAASAMWLLAGIQAYTVSATPETGVWNIYYTFFWKGAV